MPTAAEAAIHVDPTGDAAVADEPSADEVAAAELPAGVTVSPEMAAVIPTITNHAKSTEVTETTATTSEAVVANVVAPKKRKVGRPKAKRLDTPKPIELSETPSVEPVPPEAPKLRVKTTPKLTPSASGVQRKMSDLAPRTSTPLPPKVSKPEAEPAPRKAKSEAHTPEHADAPKAKRVLHHPALNYTEIEAESWIGRWHPRYALLMLFPAILLALLAGGVAAAWIHNTPTELINLTRSATYAVLGETMLILLLYYVSHSLASAALTFGIARESDHRPAPRSRWWGVAVNSFGARLRLDLTALSLQLLVLALVVALIVAGGADWKVSETLQIGALLIAFFGLLYLVAGIGLAQSLGRVGVTLGVLSAHKALALGWDFFRHHFDLIGARLIGLVLDLLMIVPFAALAIVIRLYLPGSNEWLMVALVLIGVMIVGALMGAGGAIWWQAVYRKLVRNERITEVMSLLAGRQAERPKRLQLIALSVCVTVIFVLAVVWPWLPLPSL